MNRVLEGVVIGGAGGAIAGLTVSLALYVRTKALEGRDKKRVYQWLRDNTKDEDGNRYRSTRAIASWNNLTKDRVQYICSIHEKIYYSMGNREDMWSLCKTRDRHACER